MNNETIPETENTPEKPLWKRIVKTIVITLIVLAVLFVPRYDVYKDGGTREWRAVAYTIVKWQNSLPNNNPYQQGTTKIYFFPYSLYSLDDMADME